MWTWDPSGRAWRLLVLGWRFQAGQPGQRAVLALCAATRFKEDSLEPRPTPCRLRSWWLSRAQGCGSALICGGRTPKSFVVDGGGREGGGYHRKSDSREDVTDQLIPEEVKSFVTS